MTSLTIKINDNLNKKLEKLVKKTGYSKDYYIHKAIEEYLEELEDYHTAVDVLTKVHEGSESLYTTEEVRKELDLDN